MMKVFTTVRAVVLVAKTVVVAVVIFVMVVKTLFMAVISVVMVVMILALAVIGCDDGDHECQYSVMILGTAIIV